MGMSEDIMQLQKERAECVRKLSSLKGELPKFRGTTGYKQMRKDIVALERKIDHITSQYN